MAGTEPREGSRHRAVGLVLALIGLGLAAVSLASSFVTGDPRQGDQSAQVAVLAIASFGLTTAAFGTAKIGIGVVLLGIVRRVWLRIESAKTALPALIGTRAADNGQLGDFDSRFGRATSRTSAPPPLPIHRMAQVLWAPMLVMGAMLVYAGLALSFVATGNVTADPATARSQGAWVQGLQFLGEGALLSGISFLLGTILGAIRAGGGEIQESIGLTVKTLRMPTSAKLFVGLMMAGLMVEVAQFLGYAYVATVADASVYATFSTWLGPLREFGLGLLLSGIVLALATIATALSFQFARITEIITSGR